MTVMRVRQALATGLMLTGLLAIAAAPVYAATPAMNPSFAIESEISEFVEGDGEQNHCSGAAAVLAPGSTRCLFFRVHNTSTKPITVRSITMSLDSTFPPPPSGCSVEKLSFPSFTGSLPVTVGGWAQSPGLPIRLENTATNQDDCKQTVLHFVFDGTASVTGSDPQQGNGLAATGSAGPTAVLFSGIVLVGFGAVLVVMNRRRVEVKS